LDTLITGEADYPTEVKARELGINLILGGHRETEVFGVKNLAGEMLRCCKHVKA
jgi:putative NIF3 family GTP cyclohydrolase 1 type 2